MPGVARVVRRAAYRLVRDGQTEADAGAVVEEHEVVPLLRRIRPELGDSGGGHVLLEQHRESGRLGERIPKGDAVPALEQRRIQHDALLEIERAGNRDSQAEHSPALHARGIDQGLDRIMHPGDHLLGRHVGGRPRRGVGDHPTIEVQHDVGDHCRVEMHADRVAARRIELEDDTRLADPEDALAGLPDDAFVEEST
jgi:hypothetical protein